MDDLASRLRLRDRAAVARALNLVEDGREAAQREVAALLALLDAGDWGGAHGHRVGLTGPPGVGKSTLAAALARTLRARGRTVGVVAVDPSSVRSGGALLGDRARMAFDPSDEGLFVRSLASGGRAGGLSRAASAAVEVLAAAFDVVLVETTGVGQTETDVVHVVDTVVLVVQPGSGDALQFLKAGIMEIPDLLVVNKSDHGPLADQAAADLRAALATLGAAGARREPVQVITASARTGAGVEALLDLVDAHRAALGDLGLRARRRDGRLALTFETFARRCGELGVETLGGRAALLERMRERLDEGASPLSLAAELGDAFADALRVPCSR